MAVVTPISQPRRIEQRAAGIAGVNCGVGLDHVSDFATGAGRHIAA